MKVESVMQKQQTEGTQRTKCSKSLKKHSQLKANHLLLTANRLCSHVHEHNALKGKDLNGIMARALGLQSDYISQRTGRRLLCLQIAP